jgi:NADH-quinone oxidoreductase subunit G
VRDERVLRVLARQNDEVDDGWLCDKGRFAYQSVHADERITAPMIRDGGELREVSWERALSEAASGLRRAGSATAAIAGGGASNEEGLLLGRLMRDVLGSPHLDSRPGGAVDLDSWRALAAPSLAASVSDLEFAHAVLVLDCEPLDDAPILELRIRKGVRRNGVRLAVASERPSALDPSALTLRYAPGRGAEAAAALAAAVSGTDSVPGANAKADAAGADPDAIAAVAAALREAGAEIVIVYGERLLDGGAGGLLALANSLGLAGTAGAGLIGIPDAANGRGLREAGVAAGVGPGYREAPLGHDTAAIPGALASGELVALYLLGVDPSRDLPGARAWEQALEHATTVIAHASFLSDSLREHATVIFPSEAYPEKEGTITHPDGRIQRLRPAIARQGTVRSEWTVLAELSARLGSDPGLRGGAMASAALFEAVAMYSGLTLEQLAGHGVRWPAREGVTLAAPSAAPTVRAPRAFALRGARSLALGSYRSIWAAREVAASPALAFLHPAQRVEISPVDAARLGLRNDAEVLVADSSGASVRARVAVRDAVSPGAAFLQRGLASDSANALRGETVEILEIPLPAEPAIDDETVEEAYV